MPNSMMKKSCIIIPAIKKNAVIPDQLVKKLAGRTLIQRAIDTAKALVDSKDIYVVTDSEEISLICNRNEVHCHYDKNMRFNSSDILYELKEYIEKQSQEYDHLLIYRASSPLVNANDIQKGYEKFIKNDAEILVTLKKQEHRLWKELNGSPEQLICDETTDSLLVEIKSFLILRSNALKEQRSVPKVIPFFLNEKAIEINNYQDWWICEKLLQQKHIVFVVTGYPSIGMGHVYRALTLAHEITDHRITFLCTKESELAVKQIAERDYETILQNGQLADEVLLTNPDLVVNDILNTDEHYIKDLKRNGIKVVNFEDIGPGAVCADIVINALYNEDDCLPGHFLCGYKYFCLRDEFLNVQKSHFRKKVKNLLITFGGTDPNNYTIITLSAIIDICKERNIKIFIVTGPGYLHKKDLEQYLNNMGYSNYEYIHKTGIMSAIMEQSDIAISSAGRTIFELCHMRVPSIILSQNEREDTHFFAHPDYGFEYIEFNNGCINKKTFLKAFFKLLDTEYRRSLYERMKQFYFEHNKRRVIKKILTILEDK